MDHSHHKHPPSHSHMSHMPSAGHSMDMKMYFNTDLHYTLLFSPWVIDTLGKAIVACLGSFLFAIIYEALEALRHNLLLRAACNNRCPLPYNSTMHTHNSFGGSTACPGCSIPSDNNSNKVYLNPPDANDEIHVNVAPDSYVQRLRSFCSGYHLVQTFLHMLHTFMGYMLMLIVMTYNVYLLLAVIFGFTLGYFLFAQNRALLLRSHSCCH